MLHNALGVSVHDALLTGYGRLPSREQLVHSVVLRDIYGGHAFRIVLSRTVCSFVGMVVASWTLDVP